MLLPIALLIAAACEEEHSDSVRLPLPPPEVIAELPADGGEEFNRLVFERSPYLLQHARNPVDWHPWGPEAFALAAELDRPVFLSIGYSTCHWCHVMEHESFEDAEVARLMNETFVCVKVDREERPDIDQVYMRVTQAMTGSGGWPMTVVMTPDKVPFFTGTYFPKKGGYGRPGMLELVPELGRVWREERKEITGTTKRVMEFLRQPVEGGEAGELSLATLGQAYRQLRARFDPIHGGFGNERKFPTTTNLTFLLRHHLRTGEAEALAMVEKTLVAMRLGGIWDHVGFGFHRYSVDSEWLVPHFEKMLYDQALIAMAYTEAWQVTGRPLFRRTVEEICTYVLRDMTDAQGGFYSAEDADSEGEEGLFYLWDTKELAELLSEEDFALASRAWNLKPEGNFEDEATGKRTQRNIPHFAHGDSLGVNADESTRLESIRSRLFEVRERRIHPLKDDKILTDWNGLMIAALAKAARAFDDGDLERAAQRAADFALRELRNDEGRLFKLSRGGVSAKDGLLEDYAYLVWGLIELYQADFDTRWLEAACELTEHCLAHFWDAEEGALFTTPDYGEELLIRAKGIYDGARPTGNAVMVNNLLRLGKLTARTSYTEKATAAMTALAPRVQQSPAGSTHLLEGLDFLSSTSYEVVLAGERGSEDLEAMLRALRRPFLPNQVAVFVDAAEEAPGGADALATLAPYTKSMGTKGDRATAYVCRNYACELPTNDVSKMLESLGLSSKE